MKPLESPLLRSVLGLRHGFGTRAEPVPAGLRGEWERLAPRWKQVHGAVAVEVSAPNQACGDADALFTRTAGQPIAVVTADCVPLLLARRDGGAVAAVHAGWRGTRAHIGRELVAALRARRERPGDWIAAVGPAIGPCCYEVSPELAEDFAREFAAAAAAVDGAAPVPRPRHLDLPALNAWELRSAGIGEVDLLRACTRCTADPATGEPAFHSYRREGGGTRQYSMIVPKA